MSVFVLVFEFPPTANLPNSISTLLFKIIQQLVFLVASWWKTQCIAAMEASKLKPLSFRDYRKYTGL